MNIEIVKTILLVVMLTMTELFQHLQALRDLGVTGMLCLIIVLIFYFYRKDGQSRDAELRELARDYKEIVQANTRSNEHLVAVMDKMLEHLK